MLVAHADKLSRGGYSRWSCVELEEVKEKKSGGKRDTTTTTEKKKGRKKRRKKKNTTTNIKRGERSHSVRTWFVRSAFHHQWEPQRLPPARPASSPRSVQGLAARCDLMRQDRTGMRSDSLLSTAVSPPRTCLVGSVCRAAYSRLVPVW
jgi:hypothetical protein